MSFAAWSCAVVTLLSVEALSVAYVIRWWKGRCDEPEPRWFDHTRFLERVGAYAAPQTILHPCSYGGDLLEYPVARGWDEAAILATLAEIEGL